MNLLWVDANGLVLGTVALLDYASFGGGLLLDGNGWIWILDTNTGLVRSQGSLGRFYTAPGCIGAAYVSAPPDVLWVRPRWVISVAGIGGFFARGDQQQTQAIHPASYSDGVTCSPWDAGDVRAVAFDQMRNVPALPVNPVGPAHVEQR
jgi:hypothetical protein